MRLGRRRQDHHRGGDGGARRRPSSAGGCSCSRSIRRAGWPTRSASARSATRRGCVPPTRRSPPAGVEPRGELWAAMLDTKAGWDELIRRHAPDAKVRDVGARQPALPVNITSRFVHSHDYLAMEQLHELHASGRFDLIIVDTPPSRNALDVLDAPGRMKEFFGSRLLRVAHGAVPVAAVHGRVEAVLPSRRPRPRLAVPAGHRRVLHPVPGDGEAASSPTPRASSRCSVDPRTTFVVVSTLEAAPAHEAAYLARALCAAATSTSGRSSPTGCSRPSSRPKASATSAKRLATPRPAASSQPRRGRDRPAGRRRRRARSTRAASRIPRHRAVATREAERRAELSGRWHRRADRPDARPRRQRRRRPAGARRAPSTGDRWRATCSAISGASCRSSASAGSRSARRPTRSASLRAGDPWLFDGSITSSRRADDGERRRSRRGVRRPAATSWRSGCGIRHHRSGSRSCTHGEPRHDRRVVLAGAHRDRRSSAGRRSPPIPTPTPIAACTARTTGLPSLVVDRYDRRSSSSCTPRSGSPTSPTVVDDVVSKRSTRSASCCACPAPSARARRSGSPTATTIVGPPPDGPGPVPRARAHDGGRRGARPEDRTLPRPARQPGAGAVDGAAALACSTCSPAPAGSRSPPPPAARRASTSST